MPKKATALSGILLVGLWVTKPAARRSQNSKFPQLVVLEKFPADDGIQRLPIYLLWESVEAAFNLSASFRHLSLYPSVSLFLTLMPSLHDIDYNCPTPTTFPRVDVPVD